MKTEKRFHDYVQKLRGYDLRIIRSMGKSSGDTAFWTSMNGHSASTLLKTVRGVRWRFDLHQGTNGDGELFHVVFLTGDRGKGVYRSRHMSDERFLMLSDVVLQIERSLPEILQRLDQTEIPKFPNYETIEVHEDEVVRVTIAVSKARDGKLETRLAIYDTDNISVPVVFALDGEIDQFAQDCIAIRSRLYAETAPVGKILFKQTCGNVVGIVGEPLKLDKTKPYREQLLVKIEAIDPERKSAEKRFENDSKKVIEKLRQFIETMLDDPDASFGK